MSRYLSFGCFPRFRQGEYLVKSKIAGSEGILIKFLQFVDIGL